MVNQKKPGSTPLTVLGLGALGGVAWLGYRYWMRNYSNSSIRKDNSRNIVLCQKEPSSLGEHRECSHVLSSESEHLQVNAEFQVPPDPETDLINPPPTWTRLPRPIQTATRTSTTAEASNTHLNTRDQTQDESLQWNTHVNQPMQNQEMSPLVHVEPVLLSVQDGLEVIQTQDESLQWNTHVNQLMQNQEMSTLVHVELEAIQKQTDISLIMPSVVFQTIPELSHDRLGTNATDVDLIEKHQLKNNISSDRLERLGDIESVSDPSFKNIDQHPTMMIAYKNEVMYRIKD
jgi:hypothetical protein